MASSGNTLIGSYGPSTTLSEQKEIRFIFNNFESLGKETEFYETSMVQCLGHTWLLRIYPWGQTEEARNKEMVSVFLYMKTINQPSRVKYSLEIAGRSRTLDKTFEGHAVNWGWHEFLSRSDALESLNENGALICKGTIQGWFPSLIGSHGPSTTLSEQKEIQFIFNNFESLGKETEFYETSMVQCLGRTWLLRIYPWGQTEEARNKEMVSVFLYMKTIDQPSRVKYSLEIAGRSRTLDKIFEGHAVNWGWHEFLSRSDALESLNENGALICKGTIQGWFPSAPSWRQENPLMDKMSKLYSSDDRSDVSFVFHGGNTVRANSYVLAIQCPSLYEIVQEADERENIEIENTDADLFALMVRFMYFQDLPSSLFDLKEQGVELLKMSDRFDYPELKMRIEADLVDSALKVENAAEFLILADAHSCGLMKEAAIDAIISNFAEVVKSKGWAKVSKSCDLLNELLTIKCQADNSTSGEKVSNLRKRLSDLGKDVDGTKEMLVRCLKDE